MAKILWPKLASPRYWRRSTRRIFLIFIPVCLPLWLTALLLKGTILALGHLIYFLGKLWNDPPKYRVRYYAERTAREPTKDAKVTIKRGSGERYFEA